MNLLSTFALETSPARAGLSRLVFIKKKNRLKTLGVLVPGGCLSTVFSGGHLRPQSPLGASLSEPTLQLNAGVAQHAVKNAAVQDEERTVMDL